MKLLVMLSNILFTRNFMPTDTIQVLIIQFIIGVQLHKLRLILFSEIM